MSLREEHSNLHAPFWRMLARKDVLAGLLFIAVAVLGLWISRDYPIGTALRMGTGYVPRLLCWLLFGLGVIVFGDFLFEHRGEIGTQLRLLFPSQTRAL